MGLESVIRSEVSQTEGQTLDDLPYAWNKNKEKLKGKNPNSQTQNRSVVSEAGVRGWAEGSRGTKATTWGALGCSATRVVGAVLHI